MSEEIPEYRRGVREVVKKVIDEQFGREKWQLEYEIYDKQGEEDEEQEHKAPRTTTTLQARNESLGLDEEIGKKRIVAREGPKKDQAGFHCPVCDENFMDSIAWVDHLNSQKHNRLLGMNMSVDKVNASQIKEKLATLNKVNKQQEQEKRTTKEDLFQIQKKLEEDMKKRKEQKLKQKQRQLRNFDQDFNNILNQNNQKKSQKDEQKKNDENNNEEEDEQLLEMQKFGLPMQFGSKKLKK